MAHGTECRRHHCIDSHPAPNRSRRIMACKCFSTDERAASSISSKTTESAVFSLRASQAVYHQATGAYAIPLSIPLDEAYADYSRGKKSRQNHGSPAVYKVQINTLFTLFLLRPSRILQDQQNKGVSPPSPTPHHRSPSELVELPLLLCNKNALTGLCCPCPCVLLPAKEEEVPGRLPSSPPTSLKKLIVGDPGCDPPPNASAKYPELGREVGVRGDGN